MSRLAVAIAGATASGKTTLAEAVARRVDCSILRTDDYYRCLDRLTYEQRCLRNFDHPDAVEHELLTEHVRKLLDGIGVEAPLYVFTRHTRSDSTQFVLPAPVLIVEGLFALCYPSLLEICAIRVFVDTPEDECLRRRIARDVAERGRTPEEVVERFSGHVAPMFREHVAPARRHATVVVSGTNDAEIGADLVLRGLAQRPTGAPV